MTPRELEPEWLTTKEAAQVLSVSPRVLLQLIKDGRLPAIKLGRAYRIKKTDLDALASAG